MPLYRDKAVTLRRYELGESSLIVSLFTRNRGKIKVVARGAKNLKSPFAGRLEPFNTVDVVYYGKENVSLYRLTSIDVSSARVSIAEDLDKFSRACYLAEVLEAGVKEQDPNRAVFETADTALEMIASESNRQSLDLIVRLFDVKFLEHIGYRPTLTRCVSCRGALPDRQPAAFDVGKGGLVCAKCRPKSSEAIALSAGAAKFMAKMADSGFDRIGRLKPSAALMGEISGSIAAFRNSRLQSFIKSERFFTGPLHGQVR